MNFLLKEAKVKKESSFVQKIARFCLIAVCVCLGCIGFFGCDEEKEEPSADCCEEKGCPDGNNRHLVCEGEGDNCSCRELTCCEIKNCSGSYICAEDGKGGCGCVYCSRC